MKTSRILWIAVAVLAAAGATAEEGFLKRLPPETFRAAGLGKLTDGELARLEWLFEEHRSGRLAGSERAAGDSAATEARAPQADRQPGWLHALITLKKTEERPDENDAVVSRLQGDFSGWSGRTMFRLQNGQVWQQSGGGEYVGDRLVQPAVRIYPAAMGGYWLQVEGLRQRVRVKPVKLE